MKPFCLALALVIAPMAALAEPSNTRIGDIVSRHILPRFETLADRTKALSFVAATDCAPGSEALRAAYGAAFDAWILASHLRFGPSEVDDRAFALAFWPDSRGATPRALSQLLSDQDPIAASVADYRQVSIAARGFYGMEFLLFDDALMAAGEADYHCQLIQTISADMAQTAQDILDAWQTGYAAQLQRPSLGGTYRTDQEALQEMLKSLSAGLQFTSDTRLGRPLGRFDHPRPTRAEAYRSGRSAHHVRLSLIALQDLALRLAAGDDALSAKLDHGFDRALSHLAKLNDPRFAGVSHPQSRLKIEVIQQSVDAIRSIVRDELGPSLGVAPGFNSMDGD